MTLSFFHSFITQQPAVENIQLTEHSISWAIQIQIESLLNTYHETERLLRTYEKIISSWKNGL